jgi:hypothetical protein
VWMHGPEDEPGSTNRAQRTNQIRERAEKALGRSAAGKFYAHAPRWNRRARVPVRAVGAKNRSAGGVRSATALAALRDGLPECVQLRLMAAVCYEEPDWP